jgi:hypothetical protein
MQEQPPVLHEVAHRRVARDDRVDRVGRRLDEHRQAQRLVHPPPAVVHRLPRESDAQVAAGALHHAQPAADHVVQHLVPAPVADRVHGGRVVLQVDPVGHDHRRGEDQLEHPELGVLLPAVLVQEGAPAEVDRAGPLARRDHEGRVARQPPLGAHLRPVARARADRALEHRVGGVVREPERRGALAPRDAAGGGELRA